MDTICRHFPGSEFLTCGDLGLTPGLNQPRITQRVEQVLADAFHTQAAALVPGTGIGAIRAALAALLKPGQHLLVHDTPVYPTTRVIIEQMGLTLITADFNDLSALKQVVDEQQPDAALVQHTRQQPQDRYVLADVLATLRAAGVPALTDDALCGDEGSANRLRMRGECVDIFLLQAIWARGRWCGGRRCRCY